MSNLLSLLAKHNGKKFTSKVNMLGKLITEYK